MFLAYSRAPNLPLHFRDVGSGIVCCERTLKVRHTAECGFDKQILVCAYTHDPQRGAFWLTHEDNRIVSRNDRKLDAIQKQGVCLARKPVVDIFRETKFAVLLRCNAIDRLIEQEGTLRFNRFRLHVGCS